jgi:hypothetical protein
MKTPKCVPTYETIKKTWYIHAIEYYLARKKRKKEILPVMTICMNRRMLC